MAKSKVTHQFNERQLNYIVSNPQGAFAKDLKKRAARVETRAKLNLGGGTGTGPRRVDTGRLRQSISWQLIPSLTGSIAVKIGTNVPYARYVHDGTGLYGPRKMLIKPKTAKVLVWRSKVYGAKKGKFRGKVVVPYVKGMKGNPFLAAALPAFKDI